MAARARLGFSGPSFESWLLIVALALLIYRTFLSALVTAFILAVVCRPLFEKLSHVLVRLSKSQTWESVARRLASVATQVLATGVLVAVVAVPLWVLSANEKLIETRCETAAAQASEWSRMRVQSFGERFGIKEWKEFSALSRPGGVQPGSPADQAVPSVVQNTVGAMVSNLPPFLPAAVKVVDGGFLFLVRCAFFFMCFHFFLLRGPDLWSRTLGHSPLAWRPTVAALGTRARIVLMATCLVQGFTALVAFLIAIPVFWLMLGPKHVLLLAVLAGFFQLVPVLGSATLVGAMTLYFFAASRFTTGWECIFIAVPLIAGVPDLLLRPRFTKRYGKVHPFTMLAGFVTGIEVFGPLGFVLGPLFMDLLVQCTQRALSSVDTDLQGNFLG